MKVKHIITIFLLAYILETAGYYFKVMQLMAAPELFTIANIFKVIAAILAIWKIYTLKGFKDFLNA